MRCLQEFPNDDGINLGESVFRDIPNDILLRNLPNYTDSHMEEVICSSKHF